MLTPSCSILSGRTGPAAIASALIRRPERGLNPLGGRDSVPSQLGAEVNPGRCTAWPIHTGTREMSVIWMRPKGWLIILSPPCRTTVFPAGIFGYRIRKRNPGILRRQRLPHQGCSKWQKAQGILNSLVKRVQKQKQKQKKLAGLFKNQSRGKGSSALVLWGAFFSFHEVAL